MGIARFFTTPCTIHTPSADPVDSDTDSEGIPIVTGDDHDTTCHLQPYSTSANTTGDLVLGADQVRRARRIWLPADTPILFTSTVTIGTDRYDVAGDPDTWNVGSANDHIAAVLVRQLRPGEASEASA